MRKSYCLLAATLALTGCLHSAVAIAPSSKPLAPGGYTELGPATGTDCLWLLLGFLPISKGNTLQGAMREAIADRAGADALIQVTADTFTDYWIIVGRSCTQVDGIAVRSKAP